MRPRSPIEMLVDKACGYDPDKETKTRKPEPGPDIEMSCPECREVLMVYGDESDPEGTAKIETACPKCSTGDFKISYFDSEGNLIERIE